MCGMIVVAVVAALAVGSSMVNTLKQNRRVPIAGRGGEGGGLFELVRGVVSMTSVAVLWVVEHCS